MPNRLPIPNTICIFGRNILIKMNENVLAKIENNSQNLLNMMFPALVVGPCAVTNPAHWETP